ncbi:MAG: UDP-2,3-diacylglucosamine diphosphatase [Bacteroidetes bacterium]|nr:MAG: UDP-2,3-diacylglucosamine diphosphatase [Bacteroidota bacterium]
MSNKKIYFASDFHLGVPDFESSLQREKLICQWLDEIKQDAERIFLAGDVFDFWFEHRYTVPKGFVRLLGKLAEISDNGIPIEIIVGNHDMWMRSYLVQELNVVIHHRQPIIREFYGKKFMIGHGDGLGPNDYKYKFIKKIFRNPLCQWAFARLHPNLSFGIAHYFSKRSRIATGNYDEKFLGKENEWLYVYCMDTLQAQHIDYFIFGHRHLPLDISLKNNSRYINLGDWIKYRTFAVYDGNDVQLINYASGQKIGDFFPIKL